MHEIAAGGTATNGGVTYLCAVGGDDCMVTVADDGIGHLHRGYGHGQPYRSCRMMQVADAKEMMAGDAEMARDSSAATGPSARSRALEGAVA